MPTNANSYGPYDSGAGANITENFWRLMTRWFGPAAVLSGYLSELLPFGDSTGLQAKVSSGGAVVRGNYGEWTGTNTFGLAAVGGIAGGSERWDRLIVRNDFVNNVMQIDVLTGAVGASPNASRPTLTQTTSVYEMLLADVGPLVNTTTTVTAAMVLDGRWRMTESGILFYEASPTTAAARLPAAGIIPQTGRRLEVDWFGRTTDAGNDILQMTCNDDVTTNYDYETAGFGGVAYVTPVLSAGAAFFRAGVVAGNTVAAGIANEGFIEIPHYTQTTYRKQMASRCYRNDTNVFGTDWTNGDWHPAVAAAITSLGFAPAAGVFTGTTLTLRVTP